MILYALTIFLGAFLLFQVQPVIAKMILPWFGGSASVWTTCMLFFQLVLVLGYAYSHMLAGTRNRRRQNFIHLGILVLSLATLPIIPGARWQPSGQENPILRILLLLGTTVGLPYFVLSTTGPLIQAWYVRARHSAFPYRFFALSNLASMLALLTYPVLVEPQLTTRHQGQIWSAAYVIFVGLCAATAFASSREKTEVVPANLQNGNSSIEALTAPAGVGAGGPVQEIASEATLPGGATHALWIALAMCASILFLAVTNFLSQDIASIPFLWILPLSVYLLTFIVCFSGDRWYGRRWILRLAALGLAGMAYVLLREKTVRDLIVLLPVFLGGLFLACLACHGELARLKPAPKFLTRFYLCVALGGALGGIFVGVVAPLVFNSFYELPVGIILSALTVFLVLIREPMDARQRWWLEPHWILFLILSSALLCSFIIRWSRLREDSALMVRNFYGALRITNPDDPNDPYAVKSLINGRITHGEQYLDPNKRDEPNTYYSKLSGVGVALLSRKNFGRRIGVIGLGTGTVAAYGRRGDLIEYYEINPLVVRLANTQFSFLRDTPAEVRIVLGDARLSLERQPPQRFDVLVVDAFTGDSIPVHLLTLEAFKLYFRHLKADGTLAVHISNKYLDLQPVVERAANALGKKTIFVDNEENTDQEIFSSSWILVESSEGSLEEKTKELSPDDVSTSPSERHIRLWTDDYSNLFQVLKHN